jgi:hypothetical protein
MNIVVWPLGIPAYRWASPNCRIEDVDVQLCPDRQSLERLCREEKCQISDEDWEAGHFEAKLALSQTAVLATSEQRLAHVIWAAIGPDAVTRIVFDPPMKIDGKQSCILSGAYTPPAFRGKSLYPFTMSEALQRLKLMDIRNVYGSFHHRNVPSRKGLQKTNALLAAVCFRVRLRIPRHGIKYVPLFTYGYKPGSRKRWYRRQFSDDIDILPLPLG